MLLMIFSADFPYWRSILTGCLSGQFKYRSNQSVTELNSLDLFLLLLLAFGNWRKLFPDSDYRTFNALYFTSVHFLFLFFRYNDRIFHRGAFIFILSDQLSDRFEVHSCQQWLHRRLGCIIFHTCATRALDRSISENFIGLEGVLFRNYKLLFVLCAHVYCTTCREATYCVSYASPSIHRPQLE